MNIWLVLLILFIVSLFVSSIGFKNMIWFLSVGYGLSICACGVAVLIIYGVLGKLTIIPTIACIVLAIYGFRLGGFLFIRELKNANYRKTLNEATKTEKPVPMFVKVTIWLTVSILYALQVSGVCFAMQFGSPDIKEGFLSLNWFELVGVLIMILGASQEALADHQKSKYKKIDHHKPAMKGLYRIQRCPNYAGEILFWTGVLVFFVASCVPVFNASWWMFVFVLIAWLSIVYIMLNGAKRLEKRQQKNYGEMEEFLEYTKKTPIIIVLFIPIHSLLNSKIVK